MCGSVVVLVIKKMFYIYVGCDHDINDILIFIINFNNLYYINNGLCGFVKFEFVNAADRSEC